MKDWHWIGRDMVLAIHDMQIAQHGGLDGINDDNLIESALARPQQLNVYGEPPPDVFDLAASYGFGFTKNHGFSDGNKRTGWILARLFLLDNGITIKYTAQEAIQVMLGIAAGSVSEHQFSEWLRVRQC